MRGYFAKLHSQPPHHKKRFALLASSTITLFIFGIWSLANFGIGGTSEETVAENSEVSPLQSLQINLAASLEAFRQSLGSLKSGFESVNFETEYKEMRDGALDVYGQ